LTEKGLRKEDKTNGNNKTGNNGQAVGVPQKNAMEVEPVLGFLEEEAHEENTGEIRWDQFKTHAKELACSSNIIQTNSEIQSMKLNYTSNHL
jgi:hypothetical protein